MRAGCLAALIALLPVQAVALSCRPHSVEAAFLEAQTQTSRFVVVQGRLDFDTAQSPAKKRSKLGKTGKVPDRQTVTLPARLSGKSLSAAGFETPYSKPVTLVLQCLASWCASAQPGEQVLAFVKLTNSGGVVTSSPCGSYLFRNPTRKTLRAAQRCMAGQGCTPSR